MRAVAIFPPFGTRLVDAIRAGAPVQIVHLKEGTPDFLYGVSLIKNAPHPNAAMVFLNWLLSKGGQATAGKALENYVVRKDVVEDWFKVAELRPGAFSWLEPSPSLDLQIPKKGADFAKKIFGER
ncbi:MAG: Extracellular solute-binding protein [Dehalococcoidia bacterium]|nr:Extracellular solute-binding protein [Dehalococcoidia bacterium]